MTYSDSDSLFSPWYCTGDTEINMAKNLKALLKDANKKAGLAIAHQIEVATDALEKAKTGDQVDAAMGRIEKLAEQAKPYMKTSKRKS